MDVSDEEFAQLIMRICNDRLNDSLRQKRMAQKDAVFCNESETQRKFSVKRSSASSRRHGDR